MACAGAPQERCGDADIISVFPADCAPVPDLPPGLLPPRTYGGARRMWLTAVRTAAFAAEAALRVEAAVLSAEAPASVAATYWLVSALSGGVSGANTTVPLELVGAGRALWAAALPLPSDVSLTLEYVVEATWQGGGAMVAPVEGAVSVVVL